MILRNVIFAISFWGCACSLQAQDIDSLFARVPRSVLSIIDKTSRLDMLDLYNNELLAKAENTLGGQSEMMKKTGTFLSIRTTDAGTWQMKLFPAEKDTVIVCVYSLRAGGVSSAVSVYNSRWAAVKTEVPRPRFESFLKKEIQLNLTQRQYLVSALHEAPLEAELSDTTQALTYRVSVDGLADEDRQTVQGMLRPVTYEWRNGRFVCVEPKME